MWKHVEKAEAIAGDNLRKGDVVQLVKEGEGEEKYAYRVYARTPEARPDGIASRQASRGEKLTVHKKGEYTRALGLA